MFSGDAAKALDKLDRKKAKYCAYKWGEIEKVWYWVDNKVKVWGIVAIWAIEVFEVWAVKLYVQGVIKERTYETADDHNIWPNISHLHAFLLIIIKC